MKYFILSFVLAIAVVIPASAQNSEDVDWATVRPDPATPHGKNLAVPEGWQYRLDRPDADARLVAAEDADRSDIRFVNMTPGWHITTGPAAILYHPALTATGPFRAEAEYHLFDPGQRNEAFGMFIGGSNLDSDDQSYLYFLVRKSGEFLIKRRSGAGTTVVQDWTAHSAVVPHTPELSGPATNVLAVERGSDTLTFFVNGQEVAAVTRGDLPADGIVGLRVNHALNVHVSDLHVVPLD